MQIVVEIPDEIAAKAKARGLTPEVYVQALIEDAVRAARGSHLQAKPKIDVDEFIRGMAEHSEKIPQLPDEAFTRESFYRDHD